MRARILNTVALMALMIAFGLAGCEGQLTIDDLNLDDDDTEIDDGENLCVLDTDTEEADTSTVEDDTDGAYISPNLYGSCYNSSLEDGVCWQYTGSDYDGSVPTLNPSTVCGYAGGTYCAHPCDRDEDLVGICTENNDSDHKFDTHYYAPTHTAESAQAKCTAATSEWHPV